MNETEQALIQKVQKAEQAAFAAYVAAAEYQEKHGELSEYHKERLAKTATAWDAARVEIDNYRYTTYGPF
jgi:hypothetical protein